MAKDEAAGSERRWMWILGVVFMVFLITSIAVVVIAVTGNSSSLPKKIDIVLFDRGQGVLAPQLKAVKKYMLWVNTIYVLSTTADNGTVDGVTYVKFASADQNAAFLAIESIDGISDHALFLADYTFPCRKVLKQYLFYGDRPRLFNYFRDYAEEVFIADLGFQINTLATLVLNIPLLKEIKDETKLSAAETVNRYLFRATTEERVVVRNDMNREIYIDATIADNVTAQFAKLKSAPPVFATFHSKDVDSLALLVTKLDVHFV